MRQAGLILEKFGVPHEIRIMSSSRNPDLVDEYARTASERGLNVVICSTGMSGHLAAAVAARTILPVIGVPIASSPQMVGNEALAITAQMPTGVPVATVGVDAAVNAAVLAAEIVAIGDPEVQATLWKFKDDLGGGPQALIPRYSLPEMAAVWSDEARLANWLEIEVLAVEALVGARDDPGRGRRGDPRTRGVHGRTRCSSARRSRATTSPRSSQVVADSVGPEGRWVHFGMTSSDVLDTGLGAAAARGRRPAARAARGAARRREAPRAAASRHRDDRAVARHPRGADQLRAQARGHGRSSWIATANGCAARGRSVSVGAISGVVGTYAAVDPRVEELVCARLGLAAATRPAPR